MIFWEKASPLGELRQAAAAVEAAGEAAGEEGITTAAAEQAMEEEAVGIDQEAEIKKP